MPTLSSESTFQLLDLKVLLENLPVELPVLDADRSDYATFLPPFQIEEPVIQRVGGDIAKAVAETIQVAFVVDGEIMITERGPAVLAVVDVLTVYLEKFPEHPSLKKWVNKISAVAKVTTKALLYHLHSQQRRWQYLGL
jgi:hypothetical protein